MVDAEGTPLLVAGGGGAACGTQHGNNLNATDGGQGRVETAGGTAGVASQYVGAGGQNGAGGLSGNGSAQGSAGGGLNGDGQDGQKSCGETSGGKSFQAGLRGGETDGNVQYCEGPDLGNGRFGGGGGASLAGPGGGYSGGGSAGNWADHSGYGGSTNAGAEQVNTTGGARHVTQGAHLLADGSIKINKQE